MAEIGQVFEGLFDARGGLSAKRVTQLRATLLLGLLSACSPGPAVAPETVDLPPAGITALAATEVVIPTPPVTEQAPQGSTAPFENLAETYLGASAGVKFGYSELQNIATGGGGTTGGISSGDASVFVENANIYIQNVNAMLPSGNPPLTADNIEVFWNGQSGDSARNAPVGFVEQGGDTFIYWLYNKNTGELSQSSLYNTFGPDVSQADLGYTMVQLPDGTTQDNIAALWNGEAIVVEGATTEALPEVLNLRADAGEFEQISMEEVAADESISMFDANTFPERFSAIANNWLEATDADWQLYQEFVEAARANFFQREGITNEVAALTGINENLRSLWGIGYWIQHNRERAISEQLSCLATPQELLTILQQEPRFDIWGTGIFENENGERMGQTHGLNVGIDGGAYDSASLGPILGREDVTTISSRSESASGNLLCLVQPFPDDPNRLIALVDVRAPLDSDSPQQHSLYAMLFTLDEQYTLPAGATAYVSRAGELIHPMALPAEVFVGLPNLQYDSSPRQGLFDALGGGATISSLMGKGKIEGNYTLMSGLDPQTGLQVGVAMSRGSSAELVDGWSPAWPWP
jgi:hypothetical protein